MGRKPKQLAKLTREQRAVLEKGYKSGQHHLFRRKCQCILLSDDGQSTGELANFFGVGKQTILQWLKLWEKSGIDGLELKEGRGRKPKLTLDDESQVKAIKKMLEANNRNLESVTQQIKKEMGIELSEKTLKRFLKNIESK